MFFSPLEQFNAIILFRLGWLSFDLSFSHILLPFVLIIVFFYFIFTYFVKAMTVLPTIWQYTFETLFLFVLNIIRQQVGTSGLIYFPLVFTLFTLILFANLISMTPFGIGLTTHIVLILYLSVFLCLSIFLIGFLKHGLEFLHLFIPKAPLLLLFILIPIEIFSYFIRCLSLSIRLSANIMAGHTLVFIINSFILNFISLKFWLSAFLIFPLFAILVLEFGVCFLQSYVFCILLCIYLHDSLKNPHAH